MFCTRAADPPCTPFADAGKLCGAAEERPAQGRKLLPFRFSFLRLFCYVLQQTKKKTNNNSIELDKKVLFHASGVHGSGDAAGVKQRPEVSRFRINLALLALENRWVFGALFQRWPEVARVPSEPEGEND